MDIFTRAKIVSAVVALIVGAALVSKAPAVQKVYTDLWYDQEASLCNVASKTDFDWTTVEHRNVLTLVEDTGMEPQMFQRELLALPGIYSPTQRAWLDELIEHATVEFVQEDTLLYAGYREAGDTMTDVESLNF